MDRPDERSKMPYAPYYCEENIWHLADHPSLGASDKHVAFVSNDMRACPLWRQRAASDATTPVCWDYHVILVAGTGEASIVYDLDSLLPFPCPFARYVDETFRPEGDDPAAMRPRFRLIDAATYRTCFASDRSHMRGPDGSWRAPPPPWVPITASGPSFGLAQILDLTTPEPGEILELDAFVARFS